MKKLYTGLLISLMTCTLSAQSFTEITETPFDSISGPVAFADIDGDNDQDVIIGSRIYKNDGNGNFEYETGWAMEGVTSIAFADIDGDSDQDLMVSSYITNSGYEFTMTFHINLFKNNGNGSFSGVSTTQFIQCGFGSINFADVDNDNDQDVLITGYTFFEYWLFGQGIVGPQTNLYLNDGSGLYTLDTSNTFQEVGVSSVAFADIDNDSDQDLLIAGNTGYSLWYSNNPSTILYLNDGSGIYTLDSINTFNGVSRGSVEFADIDNDNDQDVLIIGENYDYSGYIAKLYTNDGSGTFTATSETPFDSVSSNSIAFADIENDNDQDLLWGNKLYVNDGTGNFEEVLATPFNIGSAEYVVFVDIDNDTDPDVLMTGESGPKLYENNALSTEIPEINPLFEDVSMYPNPNHGQVSINLGALKGVSINVYSIGGQLIYHKESITQPTHQFELNADAGIYILELCTQNEKQQYKLIKE